VNNFYPLKFVQMTGLNIKFLLLSNLQHFIKILNWVDISNLLGVLIIVILNQIIFPELFYLNYFYYCCFEKPKNTMCWGQFLNASSNKTLAVLYITGQKLHIGKVNLFKITASNTESILSPISACRWYTYLTASKFCFLQSDCNNPILSNTGTCDSGQKYCSQIGTLRF
jgi:hypothetical protein